MKTFLRTQLLFLQPQYQGMTSPNWLLLPFLMNSASASGRSILASFHGG